MSIVLVQDDRRSWLVAASLIVFILAAALRLVIIDHQGLWADEAFSLAMATGHSVEHSASVADPTRGDYVESPRPLPAIEYRRYLDHQEPPAGLGQVLRAVQLSDTSPPFYYLLLWAWTRINGTSDAALRLFSVLWALACFPFFWLLAKEIGGQSAILPALALFSLSPLSIYYSTEGRMYSMLWFLAASLAWLTLSLHRQGPRLSLLLLSILVASAGMLTHYFYAFVGIACFLWLLIYPGRFSRSMSLTAAASVGLCILPWYVKLPQLFSSWHVTGNWLFMPSGDRTLAALKLPWSLVSFSGVLRVYNDWDLVVLGVLFLVVIVVVLQAGWRVFSQGPQLLLLWISAACLGPVAFDLVLNSFVTLEPRYALPGMPAALLLIACGLGKLPAGWRNAENVYLFYSST